MLCGIDEAGRGCVAGDLVVAGVAFCVPKEVQNELFGGLTDSKKLTARKREAIYEKITKNSHYHIVVCSPQMVDELGISLCIKNAIVQIKDYMYCVNKDAKFLFDGNSSYGVSDIKTMVKADLHIKEVSAASVLAKVTHDRNLLQMGAKFPQYNFASHKGYCTRSHIEEIKKHGYSALHRKSYRIKALNEPPLFE